MLQENWIEFKGEKVVESSIPMVENSFPEHSVENIALTFAQLWLSKQATFFQKSSGSTGAPAIHEIRRTQMQASANSTVETLGLEAFDTALLCISAEFIGGKMMIVRALEHKLNLIVGEVSGNPLTKLKPEQKIDFFSFVPYQMAKIIESLNEDHLNLLNQAKAIILGGAPVSDTLAISITKFISAPLFSTYGMTETVSHVALRRINGKQNEYFTALEGISFSQDNRNCLVIHAPKITGVESLQTNDVVQLIDQHHFEWLGRYDFVINSGGIKLHPEQIELTIEKLLKAAGIYNAFFVFGQPDEQLGSRLCIVFEGNFDRIHITRLLEKNLSPYEIPKSYFKTDSFLKTQSEKLDRKATLKMMGIKHH